MAQLGSGGQADVLRGVGGTGLEGGEQSDDHRDRPSDEQPDPVIGPHALCREPRREPVGQRIEFAVGEGRALVLGGDGVRGVSGLALEGVMDEVVRERGGRPLPELPEEPTVAGDEVAHVRETSWLFA